MTYEEGILSALNGLLKVEITIKELFVTVWKGRLHRKWKQRFPAADPKRLVATFASEINDNKEKLAMAKRIEEELPMGPEEMLNIKIDLNSIHHDLEILNDRAIHYLEKCANGKIDMEEFESAVEDPIKEPGSRLFPSPSVAPSAHTNGSLRTMALMIRQVGIMLARYTQRAVTVQCGRTSIHCSPTGKISPILRRDRRKVA